MNPVHTQILRSLSAMQKRNLAACAALSDRCCLTDYRALCREGMVDGKSVLIWSDAFQKALAEHEILTIPASDKPYYIDKTLIVPSDRRIEANENAVIRQMPDVKVILMRNEHVADGTHVQTDPALRDRNISIDGGRWEESYTTRLGYGRSGRYDEDRSMYGVSTCMLFSGVNTLTLTNMTFAYTAGFSVQIGNAKDILCEDIAFDRCFADGLHINGNTENIITRRIHGWVGDDLVALNMYDWLDSSINFGPMKNVLCEDLDLDPTSHYRALRIAPGLHWFDDGSTVDCRAERIIVRRVKGILNYKLYLQTPAYVVGEDPEQAGIGSGDYLFYEDLSVDVNKPIDYLPNYVESDPVTGYIAAFELGSNLGHVFFRNINVTLHPEQYPYSRAMIVGPKSSTVTNDKGQLCEIFDPYFDCVIGEMTVENIKINGKKPEKIEDFLKIMKFDHIYDSELATGSGRVESLRWIR